MFDWFLDILQETGATLRLPVSFVVIEFIGTFAFAISGVRLSSAKQFDIFGAWIVGMATAIGGGTLRDLLLDVPPFWMANSSYCICCALAVVWVMVFGKYLIRQDNTWFLFDTIGLALFNVIGIEKTLALGLPAWTAVAMGCITGAAGGVIRDVLINEVPLIFRKEIYALACVAGGLVYVGCLRLGMSVEVAALLSSGTVILMRMLAVHYHWQLPILKGERCVALCLLIPALTAGAQTQRIYDENVRTLQVTVEGNPTLPPLLDRRKHQHVELSWDEMSHDYQRYVYHIQHCDAEWNVSDGIFESDYLSGLNDQLIEEYEHSFNTTQIYTHYSLRLPNPQVSMLLSGNYRVQIFHEGDDMQENTPVLEAQFCIYENAASIATQVSGNTDMDFNRAHQQVTLSVGYGNLRVVDPACELKTVVMQNRRWESRVSGLVPNIRKTNGIEFTHNENLIFPAGSEYHRFEILDVHRTAMGVDRMEWFEPFYHATLFPEVPRRNYEFIEDQNGVYVLRSADDMDDATTAEYVVTHFILQSPRLPGGDVYVCGEWTGEEFAPECRMEYNEERGEYEAAILLKQGYYGYQFRQEDGSTARTMGDFYETENEYIVLVYYREQGSRYDRLVGYSRVHS